MHIDNKANTKQRLAKLMAEHRDLLAAYNRPLNRHNGIYHRWANPVLTNDHVPLSWRYDLDLNRNPFMMERIGVNATFNAGAIFFDGKFVLLVRVEGYDRKSFFAVAQSESGTQDFEFVRPIQIPQVDDEPDTNVYDMRLTAHEDGYIYGLFCTERKDPSQSADPSAAIAKCGIVRSRDLQHWERLPDLQTESAQQRNVVLHPEFINGQYGLYTRPQDGFIEAGTAGGIAWATVGSMQQATASQEITIDQRRYHTISEAKNGLGPAPIKTKLGWLHLAHGVRNTAAGLRYVLYLFITDLNEPWRITHKPGGYFLAPEGRERIGDVSNVVFSNGWIRTDDETVYIYYASSDTRIHVATSTTAQLLDYCLNTPEDGHSSAASVAAVETLIKRNLG